MRCAACVAVIVPCTSPDDPCVFVTFLSGQIEGAVTLEEKTETTGSRVSVPCDSPDVSGVFDAFLRGLHEITADSLVPPTAGTGKLEIAACSLDLPQQRRTQEGTLVLERPRQVHNPAKTSSKEEMLIVLDPAT